MSAKGQDLQQISFQVELADAGQRLDRVLVGRLAASRDEIRRLLSQGGVSLNGARLSLKHKGVSVEMGSRIVVRGFVPSAQQAILASSPFGLEILDSGDGWLAVNKPCGMPVHPLLSDEKGTVLNAVVGGYSEVQGVGEGGLRSGVVHRLDVDTSGALLVAIKQDTFSRLRQAFHEHRIHKTYRAVVAGVPEESGVAQLWLRVAQHRPAKVRVVEKRTPGARETRLVWKRLASNGLCSYVEVKLITGFLHQIRVSFSHLGFPIVGDERYASQEWAIANRLMLHAHRLILDEISVCAPEPEDFTKARDRLIECEH